MTNSTLRPGRPVWLELNAQRVSSGIRFYHDLFGWTSRPLHVPPWGSIPNIVNGERMLGNQFMAMGAFAVPKWNIWFSADLERAEARIKTLGGDVGQGIHPLGDLGMILGATDPSGHAFSLIALNGDAPGDDNCGDPCLAEFWGPDAAKTAEFYADALGLTCVPTETGAMLTDQGFPRLSSAIRTSIYSRRVGSPISGRQAPAVTWSAQDVQAQSCRSIERQSPNLVILLCCQTQPELSLGLSDTSGA